MTPPPAARRPPLVACLLILVTAATASGGCGEEGTAAPDSATARGSESKAKGHAAPDCPKQLGAFVESLSALRTQLAVGLSYEQYVATVKGLRSSYDEIPVARLTIGCLGRGSAGEKALNKHIDAANAWGECLADASCTTAEIEPVLQRKWRVASHHLSAAR